MAKQSPIDAEDRRTHVKYLNDTGDSMGYGEYLALRQMWREAGGEFAGPNIETGLMPESKLLPILRRLARFQLGLPPK
jgi:hypothetical protein